jgi:hypothetical protein
VAWVTAFFILSQMSDFSKHRSAHRLRLWQTHLQQYNAQGKTASEHIVCIERLKGVWQMLLLIFLASTSHIKAHNKYPDLFTAWRRTQHVTLSVQRVNKYLKFSEFRMMKKKEGNDSHRKKMLRFYCAQASSHYPIWNLVLIFCILFAHAIKICKIDRQTQTQMPYPF